MVDVKPQLRHGLADVIAKWQMLWPLQGGVWWQMLLPVADGIATGSFYFNLSSEVLTRTSSQTCGRWYLPTFLLRDGSLTLIYRASFIVLIWFKSSLPIILKLLMNTVTTDVTMVIYGRGGFQVFLEPFPKCSSPIYSSSQSTLSQ